MSPIPPVRGCSSLCFVTIRDAINGLLKPAETGADAAPAAADALGAEGHDDLPPELFGTALGHFADKAPIETADALAPVVTRSSTIPFEEEDLSGIEGIEGTESTYELFEAVDPGSYQPPAEDASPDESVATTGSDEGDTGSAEGDAVPDSVLDSGLDSALDAGDDGGSAADPADVFDESPLADVVDQTTENGFDGGFGSGLAPDAPTIEEVTNTVADDPTEQSPPAPGVQDFAQDDFDTDDIELEGTNLFSADFADIDEAGADPDDLDMLDDLDI